MSLKALFTRVDHNTVAAQQLSEARVLLLQAHAAAESAQCQVDILTKRVQRLEQFTKDAAKHRFPEMALPPITINSVYNIDDSIADSVKRATASATA